MTVSQITSSPSFQVETVKTEAPYTAVLNENPSRSTFRHMRALLNQFLSSETPSIAYPATPFVGELQERWEFPSDHLPIGASIDDFHIASWNVLNNVYMDWVYRNSQGLSRSLITEEDIAINAEGLTKRDLHVIEDILQMMKHPNLPKNIIALQECGRPFLNQLKKMLPPNWKLVHSNENLKDENIVIYNSDLFTYLPEESATVYDAFPSQMGRALQDLLFVNRNTAKRYRVVNVHAPGDPTLPARFEFVEYVLTHAKKNAATIALGDLNFTTDEMADAFNGVNPEHRFTNYSSYYTNVGLDFCSKTIDHIFVQDATFAQTNTPNQVLLGLQQIVDLLNESENPIPISTKALKK